MWALSHSSRVYIYSWRRGSLFAIGPWSKYLLPAVLSEPQIRWFCPMVFSKRSGAGWWSLAMFKSQESESGIGKEGDSRFHYGFPIFHLLKFQKVGELLQDPPHGPFPHAMGFCPTRLRVTHPFKTWRSQVKIGSKLKKWKQRASSDWWRSEGCCCCCCSTSGDLNWRAYDAPQVSTLTFDKNAPQIQDNHPPRIPEPTYIVTSQRRSIILKTQLNYEHPQVTNHTKSQSVRSPPDSPTFAKRSQQLSCTSPASSKRPTLILYISLRNNQDLVTPSEHMDHGGSMWYHVYIVPYDTSVKAPQNP